MKSQTTPEQAAEMREIYRASCTLRRNKNVIERLEDGRWVGHTYPSINAAKRESRGKRLYVV